MKHKWVVDGKLRWCWLALGGAALMLQGPRKEDKTTAGMVLCFICEDAVAIYREMRARGIEVGATSREQHVGHRTL